MSSQDESTSLRASFDNDSTPGSPVPKKLQDGRHDSKVSVNTTTNTRSHQAYLDSLVPPSQEEIARISSVQEAKEEDNIRKMLSVDEPYLSEEERKNAAGMIQRNYRGYRTRRQMQGRGLDPSSRWVEALREARYRNLTTPKARPSLDGAGTGTDTDGAYEHPGPDQHKKLVREKWRKVGFIAKRAAADEDSDLTSEDDEDMADEQREERRKLRIEKIKQRQRNAKTMDLQYFLEMVDLKHRYGSNLRIYHREWQKSSTNENFFYWLDDGEGKFIDCQGCSHEKLNRERVRYLSREERVDYLVKIDTEGRLCWAKNGARIDTTEKYKDSIHGIVPDTDSTPAYVAPEAEAEAVASIEKHDANTDEASDSSIERKSNEYKSTRADRYGNAELDHAPPMKKIKHVSASTIFNKLLRGSIKKNTWIFVADTSFRLYVGIKQSGAFQHSSFLHGSRIAAAGLIKIREGKLDKLSPLSGHYRPHTSQFRAFVESLKEAGVDMHHVSISRSYAVLVGLEAYVATRRTGKKIVKALIHGRDKALTATELKEREEQELDKSENAAREKRFLEMQQEEEMRDENKATLQLLKKLRIQPTTPKHGIKDMRNGTIEESADEDDIVAPGPSAENTIAPESTGET